MDKRPRDTARGAAVALAASLITTFTVDVPAGLKGAQLDALREGMHFEILAHGGPFAVFQGLAGGALKGRYTVLEALCALTRGSGFYPTRAVHEAYLIESDLPQATRWKDTCIAVPVDYGPQWISPPVADWGAP